MKYVEFSVQKVCVCMHGCMYAWMYVYIHTHTRALYRESIGVRVGPGVHARLSVLVPADTLWRSHE
jgi:hypothetical protein